MRWRRARAGRASSTQSPVAGAPAVPRSGTALILTKGGFGNSADKSPTLPSPPTASVAREVRHRGEGHGPLSATRAEPDNLRTLSAVIDTSARRAKSAIWSVFEIGGRAAPVSAGVAAARSSSLSMRHSEQIQQGCARSCPPAGSQPGRGQVSEETGARARPGRKGEPLSAITAGCVSFAAMLIPGPVIASDNPPPDNRLRGRLPSLLPGVCGPAGYGRAVAGIGWPQRLRRASRGEGAWPRATR